MQNKKAWVPRWLILLTMVVIGFSCSSKKNKRGKMWQESASGFIQTKKINGKMIIMKFTPQSKNQQQNADAGKDLYKVKFTLLNNEKMTGNTVMQYFNFGIKNSFYAVQGNDTLPCLLCERIPGINAKELLYIACFKKPVNSNHNDLRLFVADTIAGFGVTEFEINKDLLENRN